MGTPLDVRQYWPGALARTHKLVGDQPGTGWEFASIAGDFDVFSITQPDRQASDIYVWFADTIAVVGGMFVRPNGVHTTTCLFPYSEFPRFLDLDALPLVHRSRSQSVMVAPDGVVTVHPAVDVTAHISRVGDRIRGRWGALDETGPAEILWLGNVPLLEAPWLTAPGVVRYESTNPGQVIATEFSWAPR